MCSTTQSGLDFVQNLMRDMRTLQEQVGQLQTQLVQEQKSAKEAMLILEGQISMRATREEYQKLVERFGGLDVEVKQSFADVASERDTMKMKFASLDEMLGVSREEHKATNAHVAQLERDRDEQRSQVDQLTSRTAHLENDVASKASAHDVRIALGRLQELESAVGDRALRSDLFQLTSTVQALEAEVMQRSPIADVRALELKIRSCEASLESVHADLSRKAVKVDLDARTEALQEALDKTKGTMKEQGAQLDKEIRETRKASEAAQEAMGRDIQHLQHAVGNEGEQMLARFAQVDKELSVRAFSADVNDLANRLCTVEHGLPSLERAVGVVERTLGTKADTTDMRSSIEALENAVATKANHSDLLRACLGLEDQVTKMDAMASRVELCERTLESKATAVDHGMLLHRHDALEGNLSSFPKVSQDLEQLQVHMWGSSKCPTSPRSSDGFGGSVIKRLQVAEIRIEDLNRLSERKADSEEIRQRLAGKADLEHFHDRIVSVDGKTTFAI